MNFFNTEINVYFEEEYPIEVSQSLNDMYMASKKVEQLLGKSKQWYFTGYSKKDAMKSIAFDEGGPTINAFNLINKHYKKTSH